MIRLPRPGLLTAGIPLAAASLFAVQLDPQIGHAVNGLTLLVIAGLLVKGPRRHDPLHATRWLLLGALLVSFSASIMLAVYGVVVGHPPHRPWIGDVVELCYLPLAVTGLLMIPAGPQRPGNRLRAASDGLLAASALWYLVAGIAHQHVGVHFGGQGLGGTVSLAYAAGDIGMLATALTILPRCAPTLTRFVGGIAFGFVAIAANDLWLLTTNTSPYAAGPMLLLQGGMLLLAVAGVVPSPQPGESRQRPGWLNAALGGTPFLPLMASTVLTTIMVLSGRAMPPAQLLPALLVAIALMARQYASSRDKEQLLGQLRQREIGLEAALRKDELTGLGNRLALTERLTAALSDRRQWPVTVALLDLNDFKLINDTHGHSVGDQVLRAAADRLAGAVRGEDLVVRLGGDEFAVVASRIGAAYRNALADRLLGVFEEPLAAGGGQFRISPSVGIVVGQPPQTSEELLAHADAAMYRAKEDSAGGHGKVTVLDDRERRQIMRQLRIRTEIAAPDLSQFHVVYQPIVELPTQEVRGFEALLRWQHPELGAIAPSVFIPLAEQAGSIVELGEHVLQTAVADLAQLQWSHHDRRLFMGVNVSPRQLSRPEFVTSTLAKLDARGVRPDQLMIEITEHAFAKNLRPVEDAVTRLVAADITIAIDDFGTGYSTLHYLERLQPSLMKIDRSFISGGTATAASRRLVGSLITMARALGLRLIAEGIETEDQRAFLAQTGCELGQGYLFSRPVPLEEAEQLLATGRSSAEAKPASGGEALTPPRRRASRRPPA